MVIHLIEKRLGKVTVECKLVTYVVCNFCKTKMKPKVENATEDSSYSFSLPITKFKVKFGYGSKYDLSVWTMHICDKCAEKYLSKYAEKKFTGVGDEG
jgi:hypothetical protein